MNSSINLISNKNEALERQQKSLFMLRVTAMVLLSSIALISVIAFIVTTQIPISQIKTEESSTLNNITSMSKKLSSYYLIKDRLANINALLAKRSDFRRSIDLIYSKLPETLSVDSLEIDNETFDISVSGTSLIPINQAISGILGISLEDKTLKNIKLKSLTVNPSTGRYTATFSTDANNL